MTQKPYTIYDLETGLVVQTGFAPSSQMEAMRTCLEEGQGFLQKAADFQTQRVSKNGRVIRRRKADIKRDVDFKALRALKAERNHLLSQSDWTQMPDAPVDQEAWKNYRQALRDLPSNTPDFQDINWPEAPK